MDWLLPTYTALWMYCLFCTADNWQDKELFGIPWVGIAISGLGTLGEMCLTLQFLIKMGVR